MAIDRDLPAGIEWGALRGALAALTTATVLGAVWIYAGDYYLTKVQGEEKKAQQELAQARKLSEESLEAVEILQSAYPRFSELYARGFVGDEQKLLWVNQLHELESTVDIPSLQYQISTTEVPYKIPELALSEDYEVYEADMALKMGLLHEGDLFRVLRMLSAEKPAGIFNVERCTLDLLREGKELAVKQPNIAADCSLQWYFARIHKKK